MFQQRQTRVEAAPRVAVDVGPGVDQHETVEPRWRAAGQFKSDQSAERVSGEMTGGDAGAVEHLDDILGHVRDAVILGQFAGIGAGAALVIQDDAVMGAERLDLWPPEMSEPAEACGQQDCRRTVVVAAEYFVMHVGVGRQDFPMWATVAISTSASGFTSPHWIQ